MISVESRDGRRGLGLGFGGEGEMEETELEEGEASYYQDDDANIDPDVALSYLDEKVQDVLGHFQKDFEGGVSAENLGAKFGGYGSFLPTHQRSPSIWSHSRTPPKVQGYSTPRSPNILPLEGARQNSTVPSGATSCGRLGPVSTSLAQPPVSRAPFVENSSKTDAYTSARSTGEFIPKLEPANKSINSTDQKTLKVRIKVGSDNMAQTNAAIYSGLGLDISPSSSLEDSPDESGGLSPETRDSPDESPGSILHIMTSFLIPGGFLLSPLPNSLLHLMEKEKLSRDSRSGLTCKGNQDCSAMLVDESSSVSGEEKVIGEKKMKPVEKSGRSMEVKHGIDKDAGNEVSDLLRMEIDIETSTGWELVSNSLKLPILSNSNCTIGDTAKGIVKAYNVSREAHKGVVKDNFLSSDLAKEETVKALASQDVNRDGKLNSKTSLADKVWEDRKASSHIDVQLSPRNDGRENGDKRYDPFKADFNYSKGGKDLNGALTVHQKDKVSLKATPHEQDGAKMLNGKERPSSRGKKKSKGRQSNGDQATEFPKESLRVGSTAVSNDKKKNTSDHPSKKTLDDNKLPKGGKTIESHRDLSRDLKMELAVNSLETPTKDRPKNSKLEVVDKETQPFADKSKERTSTKKVENPLMPEAYPKASQIASAPSTGNGPFCDVVPATGAPVVIKENWVCCDRCQKWRLLPFGTNPDHLPKKWLCTMLNWLPGMNRCNISEEETTKALNALYQIPVPENQNNLHSQPDGVVSGATLLEAQHLGQTRQDHSLHAMSTGGKKKHGSKETSNSASFMGLLHFSNSTKNQQVSMKSRSLNDENQFPLESNLANKSGSQHLSKSSDLAEEKYRHKQKEKHKMVPDRGDANQLKTAADGGDAKQLKMKSKREADPDGFTPKKIKSEGLYYADEDWNSDHGGNMGKVGPSSSNGFPAGATTGKHLQKYSEYSSSKDSKCDAKDSLPASRKKSKDPVQVSLDGGALDMGKGDKNDIAVKKRKVKEWQASQIYPSEALPNTGHHLQVNRASLMEETSESELSKEKKARLSKSEGKESSTSKGDSRTEKRGRGTRSLISTSRDLVADGMEDGRACIENDQLLGQCRGGNVVSQHKLDGIDSLKRDMRYGQPSVAATSSSSKVSGSRKSKANFQEVKGSPVESVSSSPLRISNLDKVTSAGRILLGKDDVTNVGFSVMGSLKRGSDGEKDGGSDRPGTISKEKISSAFHRGSLESSALYYQDRDANHTSSDKAKAHTDSPYEFENPHLVNGGSYTLDQHKKLQGKEHGHYEERVNNNHYHSNGSVPRKSGKGSSSRAKDKQRSSKSVIDKGKMKVNDSFSEHRESYPTNKSRNEAEIEESKDGKDSFLEKCAVKSGKKDEKNYSCKKDSAGKWSGESRRESQPKFGCHGGPDLKLSATCSKDGKSNAQQNLLQDRAGERSSYQLLSNKIDRLESASGRGKSQLLPHSRDKQEAQTQCPQPIQGTNKGSGSDVFPVDASGDALKVTKQLRKPDNKDGAHHSSLRHSTPNGLVVGDLGVPSPIRKDSSSHAGANALKEAKDLKHSADRLKNPGLDLDRTGLYFQAALKFLLGASLLEPCNIESAKHGETQSMQVYSETAELFRFVAHEYERCKKMAAAALAYKCMEVAYMRVIYSKHSSANKDRLGLQAALQMVPPGESSSSSASDVDNLNNQGAVDKVSLAKGVTSPYVTRDHVIVAQSRPNYVRLLNFAQDAIFAMEASRKSQNAFAAANASLEEAQYGESISSVRRVLDFNFYDVQGLLRLVRLAMEANSL